MMYLIIYIFIACILTQLFYWIGIYYSLRRDKNTYNKPVDHTIVGCYKNESDNLPSFLKSITSQLTKEIVLVNDHSTDGSAAIVESCEHEKVSNHKARKNRPGKKNALLTGVNISKQEYIVLTDIDCKPASNSWSTLMAAKLQTADAVLGYGPMRKTKGWVPTFSRYETYLTGIQYLSFAQKGWAYMGVGRNLAIKKSKALPHLRLLEKDELASGDDDLLIQAISKENGKILTCLDPQTFVYSIPPTDLKSFISQKSRHISTSISYSWEHKLKLGLFAGTHILAYLLLICIMLFHPQWLSIAFGTMLIKWVVQLFVNNRLMSILDEKDLLWKTPILDIATFVYYVVLTPYLILRNKKKWS